MDSAYIKFNGGIWSETLRGRYDIANYRSAARTCENFIPSRYGQVEKRSGTKFLGYAKNDDKLCVLHPFQYSVNTKFMLEFGEQYIRFWSNDLQVESGGSPLEVVTPYLETELYELQMRSVNDVVYIVHPNHPVGKLTRIADDNWTYADAALAVPFVNPDVNSSDITLTPSASSGTGIDIVASADAFSVDHVGSLLRLEYLNDGTSTTFHDDYLKNAAGYYKDLNTYDNVISFSKTTSYETDSSNSKHWRVHRSGTVSGQRLYYTCIKDYTPTAWVTATSYALDDVVIESGAVYYCTAAHTSSALFASDSANWSPSISHPVNAPNHFAEGATALFAQEVSGKWSLKTTGNWRGDWAIQRSADGLTNWSTIRTLTSRDDSNYLVEEDENGETAYIRVQAITSYGNSREEEPVAFTRLSSPSFGIAEITAVTDAQNVVADVITTLPKTSATVSWQESAFSNYQGYPRAIALFDNRLMLAGTSKKPQGFFYSGINTYDDFLAQTTLADSPFFVETLSDDQSSIQWLSSQRELFVGTASVEGVLTTRKADEAQSPENLPIIRWNESMGSAHRSALPMRDSLMILQRGRTTINMMAYSLERDGYVGEEVSLLSSHLFSSGVQQMAHLREPYTGAFTVQEDGTLCHVVYEPKLQVTGWCKFTTQGGGFESVATLQSSSSDEDEVWCVVRRLVNGVTKRHIERFTINNRAKQEAGDTDNLWYVDSGVKYTGTDLTTISGLDHLEGELVVVLADGIKSEYTVAGGVITLSIPADTVIVGLRVTSEFEPLDLEAEGSAGKRKQLYQSKLMIYKSLGGSIAYDSQDYQELVYHTSGELMDESVPLSSGYSEVFAESSHSRQKYWRIKHSEPYPFTLQAVIQSFTIGKH